MNTPDHDVWAFGYASLIWRPDFNHLEAQPVRLFWLSPGTLCLLLSLPRHPGKSGIGSWTFTGWFLPRGGVSRRGAGMAAGSPAFG